MLTLRLQGALGPSSTFTPADLEDVPISNEGVAHVYQFLTKYAVKDITIFHGLIQVEITDFDALWRLANLSTDEYADLLGFLNFDQRKLLRDALLEEFEE